MNRADMRSQFGCKIEKVHLEEYNRDVFIKVISAAERRKAFDTKPGQSGEGRIVGFCLVNEDGSRIYNDKEIDLVADDLSAAAVDALCTKILQVSGLTKNVEEEAKNSEPTPSAELPSELQLSSGGGTSTSS
jgi:hypothetical protein